MSDSDQLLRNHVNALIDNILTDEFIQSLQIYFRGLKPFVKNREDALLGYVFGNICANVASLLDQAHILITIERVNIIMDVFQSRIVDIKSKIYKNFT